MSKKYTVYLIPDSTAEPRQFQVSFRGLFAVLSLIVAAAAGGGLLVWDWSNLKGAQAQSAHLARTVALQEQHLANQRDQLRVFAQKINSFRDSLEGMQQFEHRIRVMTDLAKPGESDGVLGIGGFMPAELPTGLEPEVSHGGLVREMHETVQELLLASNVQHQNLDNLVLALEQKRDMLLCTPSVIPVDGWISSRFGYRTSPFTNGKEFHRGLDISAPKGTEIISPAKGRVTFTGWKGSLGRVVVIDHGYGIVTRYAHVNKSLVNKGDWVARGDVIAQVGNTGRSTGSHLHYEVHVHGIPVNPEHYILN
jgi:murein DD-endopeptidase MepM/ murein hydrolase activator NlpD